MSDDAVAGRAEQIFDAHSFKINSHIQREWFLFGTKDVTLKVQRDVNNAQWSDNLRLQLVGEGFGYPVRVYSIIQSLQMLLLQTLQVMLFEIYQKKGINFLLKYECICDSCT